MTKRVEIPRRHHIGSTIEWFGDILTVTAFLGFELIETDDTANTATYAPRYEMSDGGSIVVRS